MDNLNLDFNDSRDGAKSIAIYQGYRVTIESDGDGESPREWDNACVMYCEHSRYNLGDYESNGNGKATNIGRVKAIQAIRESSAYRDTWEDSESGEFKYKGETHDCLDFYYNPGDIAKGLHLCPDIFTKPLFLYDHSGITIRTSAFSCAWDSGQVGVAFISRAMLKREFNRSRWDKQAREWASRIIDIETQTYDHYLTGAVYWFEVERLEPSDESDLDGESIDSCGGYYGYDHSESGLLEAASDAIRHDMAEQKLERQAQLKRLISNRVPYETRALIMGVA